MTIIFEGFVFKIISGDKLTYPLNSVLDSRFFEIFSKLNLSSNFPAQLFEFGESNGFVLANITADPLEVKLLR